MQLCFNLRKTNQVPGKHISKRDFGDPLVTYSEFYKCETLISHYDIAYPISRLMHISTLVYSDSTVKPKQVIICQNNGTTFSKHLAIFTVKERSIAYLAFKQKEV